MNNTFYGLDNNNNSKRAERIEHKKRIYEYKGTTYTPNINIEEMKD